MLAVTCENCVYCKEHRCNLYRIAVTKEDYCKSYLPSSKTDNGLKWIAIGYQQNYYETGGWRSPSRFSFKIFDTFLEAVEFLAAEKVDATDGNPKDFEAKIICCGFPKETDAEFTATHMQAEEAKIREEIKKKQDEENRIRIEKENEHRRKENLEILAKLKKMYPEAA